MYKNNKIFALIPARGGSKRLKNKNIRLLLGRPLIAYALDACNNSEYIDEIYVSTEDKKIYKIAEELGAKVLKRPVELAKDKVPTQEVMKHFAENTSEFDILVLVQANSPQVKTDNIDKGIRMLVDNKLWEVRSVNKNGFENGAFWIVLRNKIFWNGLSVYFGVIEDSAIDIHYEEDLKQVEKEMRKW
jgi:N-acylneuraminate cytidylyltransferase